MLQQLAPPPKPSRLRRFFRRLTFTILILAAGFSVWRWHQIAAIRSAAKPTAVAPHPCQSTSRRRTGPTSPFI